MSLAPILQKTINPKNKEDVATYSSLTDVELRARLKGLLIERLDDRTLTASDIAQLKDVFGLASAETDLVIQTIDYSSMCSDCPRMQPPVAPAE